MKIGIVSLYGWLKLWDNYGTLLQNFALQTFLQQRGYTTFWIRAVTTPPEKNLNQFCVVTLAGLREFLRLLLTPLLGKSRSHRIATFNKRNPRHFDEFMNRYVPTTLEEFTIEDLTEDPPTMDALCVGSDQVWRDVNRLNFLDFGPPHLRRIAYAVSAPWPVLEEDWIQSATHYTAQFDAVSVREVDGIEVCKRLGRGDAIHVVDPVLLLESCHYLDIIRQDGEDCEFPAPFVLGYFVNINEIEHIPWEPTVGFAKDRGAELHVVPLQGAELAVPEEYLFVPTPSAWINAFHKADCVVTNSYHGVLFAIVMGKPFLVFLQEGAKSHENCRFTSALAALGLDDRLLSPASWRDVTPTTLNNLMSRPIDWSNVAAKLSRWRQLSAEFLDRALES